MKGYYWAIILMALLVFGCQQQAPTSEIQQNQAIEDTAPQQVVEQPQSSQAAEDAEVMEDTPAAAGDEVQLLGKGGFQPDMVKIKKGSTVIWNVADNSVHIISIKNLGEFRSQRLEPGEKFQWTFESEGTYEVFDSIFKKTMTLVVE